MNLFRKCNWCSSVYVCWNWFHFRTTEDVTNWGHECWSCGACQETRAIVKRGIPSWLLRLCSKLKLIPDRAKKDRVVTFQADIKLQILDILDMAIDKEGYIVSKNVPAQRITDKQGKECHFSNFAGYCKSYGIIKEDICSLIAYVDWKKESKKRKK